jgi:hypothetical protein
MRGLLLDCYYRAKGSAGGILFLALIVGLGLVMVERITLRGTAGDFVYLLVFAVPLPTIIGAVGGHRCSLAWEHLRLTLPLRRRTIVASQFITGLIWLAVSCVLVFLILGLALLLDPQVNIHALWTGVLPIMNLVVSITLLCLAFFYILACILSHESDIAAIAGSLFIGIALSFLIAYTLNILLQGNANHILAFTSILDAAAIVILALSFPLTVIIFSHHRP